MMNKKMAQAIKKSDNIRWILMDTPIFGDKSEVISRYVLAAGKQGKFAEFHEALETAQDKTEAGLKEIGKKVGLDIAKLEKDANSDATFSMYFWKSGLNMVSHAFWYYRLYTAYDR